MSPILDAETRRRYQREWIAKRRAEFFADKTFIDCGTTKHLELDRRAAPRRSTIASGRGRPRGANPSSRSTTSVGPRANETGLPTIRRATASRPLRAGLSLRRRRNEHYREQHRVEIAARRHARPSKPPRTARTASGRLLLPQCLQSETVACADRREQAADPPRHVRHQGRSCGRSSGRRTRTPRT